MALFPAAGLAQESAPDSAGDGASDGAEENIQPNEGRLVIDFTDTRGGPDSDPLLEQQCDEEADAARIRGEIVVCRSLGEQTDGAWNQEDWERRYAEATQGPKTPDVDGTGLPNGMAPLVTIRGCFIPPCPPPPALIIDVAALPPPPAGSDADRIARGLPPLGEDGDGGRGPIGRVDEEELGLPPVPVGAP